jgi:hypothetical protein
MEMRRGEIKAETGKGALDERSLHVFPVGLAVFIARDAMQSAPAGQAKAATFRQIGSEQPRRRGIGPIFPSMTPMAARVSPK